MGCSNYMGNYNSCCGDNYGGNKGSTFALIVVLFILLIIIGATFMHKSY